MPLVPPCTNKPLVPVALPVLMAPVPQAPAPPATM
jgi:hypothetical protein